ncbi:hypothetical protein F2Q69_00027450 [Brassica cretica]|uniref:Uncharacterized protein n=1 Tax=Brassica cretica TaxID=69181 RepID=A0A8S9S486_BRACR|nr:hypothetical protein F2Q69_00027450 [Brassica cretica]
MVVVVRRSKKLYGNKYKRNVWRSSEIRFFNKAWSRKRCSSNPKTLLLERSIQKRLRWCFSVVRNIETIYLSRSRNLEQEISSEQTKRSRKSNHNHREEEENESTEGYSYSFKDVPEEIDVEENVVQEEERSKEEYANLGENDVEGNEEKLGEEEERS